MTTTQINYFLAIMEFGGFSAAAEEMFISQSSLSKQIKSLEAELGLELFNRSNNKVTLTPGGELFMKYAEQYQSLYTQMLAGLSYYRKSVSTKTIHLGSIPLLQEYSLAKSLAHFQDLRHNVQIDITEANQRELLHLLQIKKIELAILRLDLLHKEHYHSICLGEELFTVVCPRQIACEIGDSTVSLLDLEKYPFVLMSPESDIHHLCMNQFKRCGFYPDISFTSSRHFTLLNMVNEGLGISILPEHLVNTALFPELVCLPLRETITTSIGVVHLGCCELSHPAKMLFQYFLEHAGAAPKS